MEIWIKVGKNWNKQPFKPFPNKKMSLDAILFTRIQQKYHHLLVFSPEEQTAVTILARALLSDERRSRNAPQQLLAHIVKVSLGKMMGPCPVSVTFVTDLESRKKRVAFEIHRQ